MTLKWVAGGVEAPPLPQPLRRCKPQIESKSNSDFFMTPPRNRIVPLADGTVLRYREGSFWPTLKVKREIEEKTGMESFVWFAVLDGEEEKVMIPSRQHR
jgi:hypothetical protein